MPSSFQQLSPEAQAYLNERYGRYGISGEDGFNEHLKEQAEELSSDELVALLREKDISHIVPQAIDPEQAGDLDNIFLEDAALNRARGARLSSDEEIAAAYEDLESDVAQVQAEDSTWEELSDRLEQADDSWIEEILGGSLAVGTILSGVETSRALRRGEINLNEVPQFFTYKAGGRTIRFALLGLSLSSGSPILVSGGVGYLVYKNKGLIKSLYTGGKRAVESERGQKAIAFSRDGLDYAAQQGKVILTNPSSQKLLKMGAQTTEVVAKETGQLMMEGAQALGKAAAEGGKLALEFWRSRKRKP